MIIARTQPKAFTKAIDCLILRCWQYKQVSITKISWHSKNSKNNIFQHQCNILLSIYLRLLDMADPPKPNTRACSMPHRNRASRGGNIPSAHSRGRKRNSTWRTWLASWSSGTGPENLNQTRH